MIHVIIQTCMLIQQHFVIVIMSLHETSLTLLIKLPQIPNNGEITTLKVSTRTQD